MAHVATEVTPFGAGHVTLDDVRISVGWDPLKSEGHEAACIYAVETLSWSFVLGAKWLKHMLPSGLR